MGRNSLGKVKKDFTVDKSVIEEFDQLIKNTSYNRSTWIEERMRRFIRENKNKSKQEE